MFAEGCRVWQRLVHALRQVALGIVTRGVFIDVSLHDIIGEELDDVVDLDLDLRA